ncbi:retrovirus-related pol polyprotein from transposon TNT 1-94 [Tanacetum coccineum]
MMRSSTICLLSKASKNKSWLWHRRLNHLNFGTLNDLARKDLARGLPRLKFEKDHLCLACQLGKSRKATHKPKMINTITEVLHTLHMDLCGPLRVQSINGKKHILVIVDDYFRFTWVKFLRSKDETPIFVINLLKQLQVGLNKTPVFVINLLKQLQGISELTQKDMEGPAYKIVKVFHPDVMHLQFQMEECRKLLTDQVDDAILRYNVSKPLPLGGDPGHVTIQSDFFFNKDLEYLRYGRKIGRPALSISKMKAAYYPDVSLEQMVPDQMWIDEECKYDVAVMYGISHWWFQRQRFYIDRHTSEGDRRAVRTHMRILSVVRIEVFPMYGYNYMKKIVLRRADLKEYVIAERDFKYLYPSDFEDLYLLNLQGHLNHLSPEDKKILTTAVNLWTRNLVIRQRVEDFQLGIESYQTQLNLTKPRWDAKGFEYKHDFTVIDSPRAVTFRDKYGVQMIMRFNEIHKFSDGTLHQIDEALDYRVKEFRVNRRNPGLDTRFWTKKDVDRSKEFMFAIQKRLKTRRIFRNLESFVGGRIREGDYRLLKRTE